jgi:signal transduction histidine kinase
MLAEKRESSRNSFSDDNPVTPITFAHEFINELTVVHCAVHVMEAELANHNPSEDGELKTAFQRVKTGIDRLGSLLREFRSIARPETFNIQPTPLAPLIQELLTLEERRYVAQGIRVQLYLSPKLPPLMLDTAKFKQALLNLLRNAAEAMPEGGTLTVRGYRTNLNVQLAISDSGRGVPPGLDVFALFSTTKPNGTGLGLSIARQIISHHGGTISFTTKAGKGTIFRLTLPLGR